MDQMTFQVSMFVLMVLIVIAGFWLKKLKVTTEAVVFLLLGVSLPVALSATIQDGFAQFVVYLFEAIVSMIQAIAGAA
ncbi:hypothetical protein GCM10027059_48430 [Myceligenerans halotolerans]